MKTCLKCKMTLDAHCTCPACGTDITNEPYTETSGEIYKFNRYLVSYLLKNERYSLVCVFIDLLLIIISIRNFNFYFLMSFILVLDSLFSSMFKNRIINFESAFFTESHSETRIKISKYGSGLFGVCIAIIFTSIGKI